MDLYHGNLRQFAEELLANGKGNGQMVEVAQLDNKVIEDLANKGVVLQSLSIVVTQQAIFKYVHHPKTKKGAVIPIEKYDLIEKALTIPLHIYEDTAQKEIVYVFTHPYETERLVKVVVHPNYKLTRKVVANVAKSWGVIERSKMNEPQFKLLK